MPRLHAGRMTALHVDNVTYKPGADGWVELPPHHVDAALSHGCSRTAPQPDAPPAASLEDRVAALEAQVSALASVAGARKR